MPFAGVKLMALRTGMARVTAIGICVNQNSPDEIWEWAQERSGLEDPTPWLNAILERAMLEEQPESAAAQENSA